MMIFSYLKVNILNFRVHTKYFYFFVKVLQNTYVISSSKAKIHSLVVKTYMCL